MIGLCCIIVGLCLQMQDDDPSTSTNRQSIYNIVSQRIGIDQFNEKIDNIRRHQMFSQAEQSKV